MKNNELIIGEISPLCPECNHGLNIKWGGRERKVQYFFGKQRIIFIQRYKCSNCGRTFGPLPNFITKFRRFAKKALRDMVDMKLWLSSSYRKTTKWSRIHGASPTLLWKEIQKLGQKCREAFEQLNCMFSGTVCIDEVWIRKRKGKYVYVFAAVDATYGHVIWINSCVVKAKGDKSKAAKQFLKDLKELGCHPKVIITDGDPCYPDVISKVFPKAKHQRCILHIKWDIEEDFRTTKKLELSPELEELLECVLLVFDLKITKREAIGFLETAIQAALLIKAPGRVVKCLKDLLAKKDQLFVYLDLGTPKSNSWVESLFSFFEPIQVISRNFPNAESVRNLFTAAALHYNFTPKMDSVFEEAVPIRRAGYEGPKSLYDFLGYAV